MAKLPWFKWYPDAWLSDEKLRACCPAARGLWIDLLSLMHKNDRRGYLQLAGKPVTVQQLARMTGCEPDDVSLLLAELLNSGVASATDDGIVYSRRMVDEEQKREKCSEAGKRGGGNPRMRYQGDANDEDWALKGSTKGSTKGSSKVGPKVPLTSNLSPLEDGVKEGGQGGRNRGRGIPAPGFERFWAAYPRRVAKQDALKAWDKLQPDAELLEKLLGAIERQKLDPRSLGNDLQYIPYPASWLNARRWEDEPTSASTANNGHAKKDLFASMRAFTAKEQAPNDTPRIRQSDGLPGGGDCQADS